MDQDIYQLVAKYGFKDLHSRLTEIMREEYLYFQKVFSVEVPVEVPQMQQVLEVVEKPKVKKLSKAKKQLEKKESVVDTLVETKIEPEEVQFKDIIVTGVDRGFRDPKEMKEYQKNAEEARRIENNKEGLQLFQILTKDNLKKWIEDEGHTYAWVAREKAGCAETQVAATAQMMGIKSKISKRRGIIMSGH